MTAGDILLYIGLLSALSGAILMFIGKPEPGLIAAKIAAFSLTLSFLILIYAFVFLDFSLFYVWQHSSADMSLYYRLGTMIVGQEGTYLAWAFFSILIVLSNIMLRGSDTHQKRFTNGYALLTCAFLIILTIKMTPFKSIYLISGASLPLYGNGLNPALTDILMPPHIATAFLAYAFTIIPASASLSYLTLREEKISDIKNHLRLSWLFLSISMITGGIWANHLLGWNGFWQWDPTQSATMGMWLLLTAVLHAVVRFNNRYEYKVMFPFLCIGTFISSIFITLVARSGIITSVHSFAGTPTWWILILFLAVVIDYTLILVLWFGLPQGEAPSSISSAFGPNNTFYFTILILILMAFISFWGPMLYVILSFMGQETIILPDFYNILSYPLVLVLTYITGICILYGRIQLRILSYVCAVFVLMSLILGIAVPHDGYSVATSASDSLLKNILGSISILSYLPAFFFVVSSIMFKIIKDIKMKNKRISLRFMGINLIHIGFVCVVMGAIISTSFATTYHFNYGVNDVGVYKENGPIGMRFLDFRVEQIGKDWVQIVDVEVTDGKVYNSTIMFWKSSQFGFISRPDMRYGLLSDTKIEFQGSVPHLIQADIIGLDVTKKPFESLVWIGCLMFILGILSTLSSDISRKEKKGK
ncbi:MAG: cytochrome c biogenesis protein CcsA [Methanosarcinaceae archaeon]|nr:cytochrome c biogenesis protein CcsA [Methanosarcinaceae archaeon]